MGLRTGQALGVCCLSLSLAAACGASSKSGDEAPSGQSGSAGRAGAASDGGDSNPPAGGRTGLPAGGNGGATHALDPRPGDLVFADDQVLELNFTLSSADREELEERGNLEQFVPAAVSISGRGFAGVAFDAVGLRHKGNWTLHHCWDDNGGVRDHSDECRKLSYKIKFDYADHSIRFDGLKRLNLHAASGDASKLREFLAYSAFRDFGVDAPRTAPARVSINGELIGLFIAVEEIDGRYAQAHFPDGPDGNLYKEVWPRSETPDQDFIAALETNEAAADVSDLRAFAEAIAESDVDNFVARMESWVDLDQVLRYVAVDRALKNWDGIMAFYQPDSPHNFFWYHDDGADGRFHLLPWDLDNAFWEFDPYMHPEQWVTAPPVPDWNVKPRDCSPRSIWEAGSATKITPPRCDPFLNLLAGSSWSRFVELGGELLAGPLRESVANAKIEQRVAQIDPIVAEDPTLDHAAWQSAVEALRASLARGRRDFRSFLDAGLTEETSDTPIEPPDDLDRITDDAGLHVGGITNFEFASAPVTGIPANVYAYSDSLTTYSLSWNSDAPISGTADLRIDFTFRSQPASFDEYVGLGIAASEPEVDVQRYSRVTLTLASDVARSVRFRLSSPVYSDTWGDIWSEFGVELAVGTEPTTFSLPLAAFAYPEWAKAAWTGAQGFTTSDAEARQLVLGRFRGFEFTPIPIYDANNELATNPQPGWLSVDNLYFE